MKTRPPLTGHGTNGLLLPIGTVSAMIFTIVSLKKPWINTRVSQTKKKKFTIL
jgi:hypothetical protein